jgi:formylglycine-generating enzyme required for sulfatase activity
MFCRNSIGMRLVEIPGGSFDMGSTVGPGEAPVHRVSVRSFWMGVTEVTQAQWQAVMGDRVDQGELERHHAPGRLEATECLRALRHVRQRFGVDAGHLACRLQGRADRRERLGRRRHPYHTLRGGGWDLPAFFLHAARLGPYGEIHRRGFRVAADHR